MNRPARSGATSESAPSSAKVTRCTALGLSLGLVPGRAGATGSGGASDRGKLAETQEIGAASVRRRVGRHADADRPTPGASGTGQATGVGATGPAATRRGGGRRNRVELRARSTPVWAAAAADLAGVTAVDAGIFACRRRLLPRVRPRWP